MNTKRIVGLLVGVFIALAAMKAIAQPCTTLRGTVLDQKTGETLPGAHVRIKNRMAGTSTDVNGNFELSFEASDTVSISYVGYNTRTFVPVECSMTVGLSLSSNELNSVVIQSEKLIAEEFTIRKIKKLDIYTNPSAKADPILAVNSTPSATTTDESANISLRGSSPAETGIFFNNVPINDAVRYSQLNGIGTFSIFNTALVSNVQVYPGNPPLEYGSTTSGLISLQSDETISSKSTNTLSLTLASLGYYTQRKVNTRSSLTLFTNYQPSVLLRGMNPKAMERIKLFQSVDLGAHYFLKVNDQSTFKVFTYGIAESYVFKFKHPTYEGEFNQQKLRNFTIVNFRQRFKNSELSLNHAVSFSTARYSLSTIDVDIALNDLYSSVNYQYFGNKAELKGGLCYDYKSSDFKGKFPVYPYAIGEQYPTDSTQSANSVKVPEAYVYLKFFLAPKWTLGTGARKNLALKGQDDFVSRQLNINYKPSKSVTVNLAAGNYNKFQLPQGESAEPFHIAADQYSLDVSYKKTSFEHSLSLFYKKSNYSGSQSTVRGLELFTRHTIARNLKGQLSLTSLDATLQQPEGRISSPYDIHYFLRGNLEYKFAGTWSTTMVFLFRQGSFHAPVTGTLFDSSLNVYAPSYGELKRLPSYNIVDLNISKMVLLGSSSAVVFLGVSNVFDFTNVRGYSYNFDYTSSEADLFSQRTFFVGGVWNF